MAQEKTIVKEPLIRIEKNRGVDKKKAFIVRAVALVLALLVCGIFVNLVGGLSLGEAYKQMWEGTFGVIGNQTSIKIRCWDTAIYAAKLLCIATALTPAFKMRFWNIGAEGQVLIGAMATAYIMHEFAEPLAGPMLYIVMFLVCIIAGAIWGFIPAFFKAKFGTNETLFTLMMNYVAMKIVDCFYNLWKGKKSAMEAINMDTHLGYLPNIADHGYTINIIIFVALAIGMYFYLKKTKHGFEIAVVGESQNTARYAGINVKKVIIRTMILSGAICGLCGGLTVMGQTHSISSETTAGGYGFTAIIVAWLGQFNTLSMIAISLLILFLEHGTGQLGNVYGAFATGAGDVMIGLVLFFIIGCEFFVNYKVIFRGAKKKETVEGPSEPKLPTAPDAKKLTIVEDSVIELVEGGADE